MKARETRGKFNLKKYSVLHFFQAHRVIKDPKVFLDSRDQQVLLVQPDFKATEVCPVTLERLGIAANPERLVPRGTKDQAVLKDQRVHLDQLGL